MKIVLKEISEFEYVEEAEIFLYRNPHDSYDVKNSNDSKFFPLNMKNVKKIAIFSLGGSEHEQYLRRMVPAKISYELQICRSPASRLNHL